MTPHHKKTGGFKGEVQQFVDRCNKDFLKAFVVVDEGHSDWEFGNSRAAFYLTERFLSTHLGGDVEPLDFDDIFYTDMTFVNGAENFPELVRMLALYKGWGYCRFHEPLQGIMVPHPRAYEFPYKVYFAHKGNALVPKAVPLAHHFYLVFFFE